MLFPISKATKVSCVFYVSLQRYFMHIQVNIYLSYLSRTSASIQYTFFHSTFFCLIICTVVNQQFSKWSIPQNYWTSLLKQSLLGPPPVSDSVGRTWKHTFPQVPRRSWCCWLRNHTLKTTCVDYDCIKSCLLHFHVCVVLLYLDIRPCHNHSPPFRLFPGFCYVTQLCSDYTCTFIISPRWRQRSGTEPGSKVLCTNHFDRHCQAALGGSL